MRLILTLAATACIAHAAITNATVDGVTQQQAVLSFTCGAGPCTVAVSDLAGNAVDDSSETLFPGSTQAMRRGSVQGINGRITFVSGLRYAEKATDNLLHSRSLSPLTSYKAVVTDTNDSNTATVYFTTGNLPSGNLYPEQAPFNADGYLNAGYPTVDVDGSGAGCGNFLGTGKPCIDPVTGLQYWVWGTTGVQGSMATIANLSNTLFSTPTITTGACDVPANMIATPNSQFANCTGLMSATMTAAAGWQIAHVLHPVYPFGVSYANNWFAPVSTVDDLIVKVAGYATDNTANDNQVTVSLNGAPGCSASYTVTLPVGTSPSTFSVPAATPTPYWRSWCTAGFGPDQGYAAQPSITVTRVGSGGTVSLSVWYEAAASYGFWNFESGPIRCEDTARSIPYDRSGNSISPALNGYLCFASSLDDKPDIFLWIPFNANGSIRAETRWLGEVYGSLNTIIAGIFGGSFYGLYAGNQVAKVTYNTSKNGPSGPLGYCHYQDLRTLSGDPVNGGWYPSNLNAVQPSPCVDFSVVVANVATTILTDWATHHPDITDTTTWGSGATVYFANGIIAANLTPNPSAGNPSMIYGFFDTTGALLGTSDNWTNHYWNGSAYVPKLGFARSHGQILGKPGAAFAENNVVECDVQHPCGNAALDGPWQFPITAVNRAGFGSPTAWDCPTCGGGLTLTTAIGPSDLYQCPNTALTRQYCPNGSGGAGSCCVQIQATQEPCTVAPSSSVTFAGGTKTEAQQFPCTKTDNSTVVSASQSKLQNTLVGDWMSEANPGGVNNTDPNWESFIIATKDIDGNGNLTDYWLIREASPVANAAIWSPFPAHQLSTPGVTGYHPCMNYGAGCPPTATAWGMMMRGGWIQDPGGAWQFPTNGGVPRADSPQWGSCHNEDGPTARATCSSLPPSSFYQAIDYTGGTYGSTIFHSTSSIVRSDSLFAGSTAPAGTTKIQTYMGLPQTSTATAIIPHNFLSWRHLNPPFGSIAYTPTQFCSYSATNISGNIYRLFGGDCYANADDPKNIPSTSRANPYLLQEISGPGSAAKFPTTSWSTCQALQGGECVAGSQPGYRYANVPSAQTSFGCGNLVLYTLAVGGTPQPCFYSASSVGGRLEEMDTTHFSADGFTARPLSYVHTIPGGVAQQSYPSWDPTGHFALVSGGIIDGRRYDVMAVYIPPMSYDSVKRTQYVPVNITHTGGKPGDTRYAEFGYSENSPGYDVTQGLYPMPRQEAGRTDATGATPFTWASEPLHATPCASGCTLTINAIPGRILYYREFLNNTQVGVLKVMAVQ